jgi:hypothetical protein
MPRAASPHAAAALLALALGLAACAEGQPRDNTGQRMQMQPVATGDATGFPLNVSAFLPSAALSDFQRSERDGQAAYVDTLNVYGVRALHYQWLRGWLTFAVRSYREVASRQVFEQRLKASGLPILEGKGEITPVRHARYPSVGHVFAGPGQRDGVTCVFGVAAYGVRTHSSETQGLETADALLTAGLCGSRVDAAAFVWLFNGFVATAP